MPSTADRSCQQFGNFAPKEWSRSQKTAYSVLPCVGPLSTPLSDNSSHWSPRLTEIPEHLLKRSRAAKGGGGGSDGGTASSSAVEPAAAAASPVATGPAALAAASAAVPADKPAPAAPPEPHYIRAAKARKKMPMWAMGLVAALPVWALSYAGTMQQQEVEDLLFVDAEIAYTQTGGCAGCHGAGGGGGTGYQLSGGEVLATFPDAVDMMVHVARGSAAIQGEPYGDPARPGGQHVSGARNQGAMPAQLNALTQVELEMVIFHERAILSGEDTSSPAYEEWMNSMRERLEAGDEPAAIDLEFLLSCASPEYTPGATGGGEGCPLAEAPVE